MENLNGNRTSAKDVVEKTIAGHRLIEKGDLVLTGISGGADSVCLLHILHGFSNYMGFSIAAVHVNHMLRGRESDGDEEYVGKLCRSSGIPLYVERRDVGKLIERGGISPEEAARKARYDAFKSCMGKTGADRLALAHNRNDQAETVFMNLIRGAGIDGLTGMAYRRGRIIRPLLDAGREQIEEYCHVHELHPRTDSSNFEDVYTRNRVRNRIMPEIREAFGTDPADGINRMARLLKIDADLLNREAEDCFNRAFDGDISEQDGEISLKTDVIRQCHRALSSRVIRMAVGRVAGNLKGLEKKHVDDVIALVINGGTGKVLHLPNKVRAGLEYDRLVFYRENSHNGHGMFEEKLGIPGTTCISSTGVRFKTELIEASDSTLCYTGNSGADLTQFFDYDRLGKGIIVRNRRKGDLFQPVNSPGGKKLKDYLIDRKIPRRRRDDLPLITNGKEIVWIPGHNISDKFKVTDNTKTVLKIAFEGIDRGCGRDEK